MLKQIKPKSNPIHILLVILAFIVIGICLFFYVTHTPISQDESMYLTAGVLAQNLTLYKDFAYLQMPYLPLIYAFVFRLFGAEYPMLGAQLINYVFIMLSVFMVYILTDKQNYFALALVFFFSFNMIFLKSIDYMANSIAPIPFSLGAFYFFTRNFKPWRYFLSGVLLCISIGIKLYYIVFVPAFILGYYLANREAKLNVKPIVLFAMGIGAGMIPLICLCLNIDLQVIWFNNMGYHRINSIWRQLTGYPETMTLFSRLMFYVRTLIKPTVFSLAGLILFLGILNKIQADKPIRTTHRMQEKYLILTFIILFSWLFPIFIKPLWIHYFVMSIPFIILLIDMLYQNTTWTKRRWIHALTALFLLITLGFGGAECFKYFPSDLQSQKWQAEHFHRQAIEIKTCIQNRKGAIATLSPHYVIEAGLDVYREFATGPFIYRVGNLLSAQALKKYRGVSGVTLDTFFANSPPLAILVGHYPDQEARFINWAENHGYKKIYLQKSDLILYLKQSG